MRGLVAFTTPFSDAKSTASSGAPVADSVIRSCVVAGVSKLGSSWPAGHGTAAVDAQAEASIAPVRPTVVNDARILPSLFFAVRIQAPPKALRRFDGRRHRSMREFEGCALKAKARNTRA